MDDDFSRLQPGSYGGVFFAVVDVTIETGSAVAFHKYPHRPSHQAEYQGRDPVSGTIVAAMYQGMRVRLSTNVLWPDNVELLRERVQEQFSQKLVIPPYGELKRAVVRMGEQYRAISRNGCIVTLHYSEDMGLEDPIQKGSLPSSSAKLTSAALKADAELAIARYAVKRSLADLEASYGAMPDLSSAITKFKAMQGQAHESINRPLRMAESLIRAVDDIFDTTKALGDPSNFAAREALLDLKDAIAKTVYESKTTSRAVKVLVTAEVTNVTALAQRSGNTVTELIQLNSFADPNDIEADRAVLIYDTSRS